MKPFFFASTAAIALAGTALTGPAHANEYAPAMENFLESQIRSWAQSDVIVAAINAQNVATGGYDQSMIDQLDTQWRAEVGTDSTPTITPVLDNDAAGFLRGQVDQLDGVITEVFIMDAHGLNVAASGITSDYWQGDEAKFSKTYGVGADAYHLGDIELDESSGEYQGQISLTITDPATGQAIGAMTVGVNADALM